MLKPLLAGVLVLGLLSCSDIPSAPKASVPAAPPTSAALDVVGAPVPGRYIVRFRTANPDWRMGIQAISAINGPMVVQREFTAAIQGAVLQMSDEAAAAMRLDPNVASVEQDRVISATSLQLSPPSWGLDRIDQRTGPLNQSYSYGFDGTGITVYILDSGIEFGQADFGGRARTGIDMLTANGTASDCNGHGTHVAGSVGGAAYGVAKRVSLVSVRVLDCGGHGFLSDAIAGVDWILANSSRPAVVNMSLGTTYSAALNQSIETSIAAGITYVVAAGNAAVDACTTSPASAPNAISVGATDISDAFAYFSNFGPCVRINAPGVNITSLWLGTGTNVMSGTSMAAPHVAGAAALYLQAYPQSTPAQVRNALTTNATPNAISGVPASTPNLLLYTGFLNVAPVASFAPSCTFLVCTFDASATTAFSGATYAWNFGDGSTAWGASGSHTYAAGGTFTVTLTVTDVNGPSTTTRSVTIAANRSPVAVITAPAAGATFTQASNHTVAVSFTGTGTDPEDGALSGASLTWTSSLDGVIGTGASVTKSDLSVGTHTITLGAKDAQGVQGLATAVITIAPPPVPVPSFTVTCTFLVCAVDAGASTAIAGATYAWEFGDATTAAGVSASHTYSAGGTYPVKVTITDVNGTAALVHSVTVVPNTAPSASIASPTASSAFVRATNGTVVVSFSGSGNDAEDGTLGGASLVWTSSLDGQIGTGQSFSRSDLSVGAHTITLTARDAQGLVGTAITTISIAPPPVPIARFTVACTFLVCSLDATTTTSLSGATYAWSFGDATSGSGATTTHSFAAGGTFTVTLTVTDANGTGVPTTRTVSVVPNTAPVAAIASPVGGTTFTRATNGAAPVSFVGSGNDAEDGVLSGGALVWTSSRDGQIGTGASFSRSDLSVGAHTITLTVRDAQGVAGTSTTTITIAPPLPVASFTASCTFLVCSFDASASTAVSGATYAWSFGDASNASGVGASHTFGAGGSFQVTLTVTDANGNGTQAKTVSVVANNAPTAAISAPGSNATFTRSSGGSVLVSFSGTGTDVEDGSLSGASLVWTSSRDGQIGTGTSFTRSDLSVGAHTITLTAKDAQGLVGTSSRTITIVAPLPPVANFNVSCTYLVCSFDATSSTAAPGATYAWRFGDDATGTGTTISHTYLLGKTYPTRVTVTDANGANTMIRNITIVANKPPVAAITQPASNAAFTRATNGTVAVSFAGSGADPEDGTLSGASLVWTSSLDGQIGTGASFVRGDLSVGAHTITLSAKDGQGVIGTASTTITIAPAPVPIARFTVACTFLVCTLDASTTTALSGATYAWSFGDATTGAGVATSHTFAAGGSFVITLTVTDANGAGAPVTKTVVVVPNSVPVAAISAPAGGTSYVRATDGTVAVSFSGTGNDAEDGALSGSSLVWTSSRDGQIGSGSSFTRSDLSVGTHTITLSARDAQGAVGTATTSITIAPPPLPVARFTVACTFLVCSLDAGSSTALTGATFAWNFGDGSSASGVTTSHTFAGGGNYVVTVTASDANGTGAPVTHSVTVAPDTPPAAAIASPSANTVFTRAPGGSVAVQFNGSGSDAEDGTLSGASLVWTSSRDGVIGTGASATRSDLSVGTHTITLTASDAQGLTSTATTTITILPPPLPVGRFTASCSYLVCSFDASTSTALSGASYNWSFGDGSVGAGTVASHAFSADGTFGVTLSVSDANGSGAAVVSQVTVAANRAPVASIASPASPAAFTRAANGTVAVSFAGSATDQEDGVLSGTSLVWTSNRDGQIGTGASFTKSDLSIGTHTITLTARDGPGAVGTTTAIVTILPSVPMPIAIFTTACAGGISALGHTCSVDATGSTNDPMGPALPFFWDFGDGKVLATSAMKMKHQWPASGSYLVTLRVTDSAGLVSTLALPILVP